MLHVAWQVEILLYIAYALVGVLSGIMGGLLGISGGAITVPCLLYIFQYIGIEQDFLMHFAIGTSLAAMVFNSISATYSHDKRGAVLWDIFRTMLPGLIIGSFLGALIARVLPSSFLQKIFGGFECLLAIYFFLPYRPEEIKEHKILFHGKWILRTLSFGISCISNILGLGGGAFMVPSLIACNVPTKKAIGTSAATGLLITFLGAISYLSLGMMQKNFPDSIGFLYLPAFIVISITTFLAAPYGTMLAHRLPTKLLRYIFAVVLIGVGVIMIL
jgi:uncharacterized protein